MDLLPHVSFSLRVVMTRLGPLEAAHDKLCSVGYVLEIGTCEEKGEEAGSSTERRQSAKA